MRRFLALLGLIGAPLSAQDSTGQIRGKVSGTAGEPIDGAQIQIAGTDRRAESDAAGNFIVRGLAKGAYVVEVRRIGFKAQRFGAALEASETKEVKIRLERGAYDLPQVTVTARQLKPIEYAWTTRYDDVFRRKHVGLGAYVMRDHFDRRGAGRTPSLLTGIRGVRLKYNHHGVSGTEVNITGCDRVSVWIDGQKQRYADVPEERPMNIGLRHAVVVDNSGKKTGSHLERVLPSQIEMIEVYRGPAEMPAEFLDDSCAAIAIWTR